MPDLSATVTGCGLDVTVDVDGLGGANGEVWLGDEEGLEIAGYPELVLADGAVGYWPLDDPPESLTARDLAGNAEGVRGDTMDMGGLGVLPARPDDTAASFSGTCVNVACAVTVQLGSMLPDDNGQSIEWWCRIDGLPSVANGDVCMMGLTGSPELEFWRSASNGMAYIATFETVRHWEVAPIPNSGEHHFVVTRRTGGQFRVYQDGVVIGEVAAGPYGYAPFLMIGANTHLGFKGQIGHVAIYSKELTVGQIATHYAMGMDQPIPPDVPGLPITPQNPRVTHRYSAPGAFEIVVRRHGDGAVVRVPYATLPCPLSINPVEGRAMGGTRVEITGTLLSMVEEVWFGGQPAASWELISDELIVAESPRHV